MVEVAAAAVAPVLKSVAVVVGFRTGLPCYGGGDIRVRPCDGDEQPQLYIVGNVSAMDLRGYQQYHDDGTLCRDDTLD